jgi:hypothetical protein
LPVDARDRKFGEHGIAFMICQQELRPNEYVSTGIVYPGAKQRCTMTAEGEDRRPWSVPLRDGETASYAAFASDNCNDVGGLMRLLGVGHSATDAGRSGIAKGNFGPCVSEKCASGTLP